jgi:plasmid maintenance system antidote protein VapI
MKGTIYIRDNEWWKSENVYKLGIAEYAKDRESTYITGELIRGEFVMLIHIELSKMKIVDNLLKYEFQNLNINKGGGTEFYDRSIKDLIIPFLDKIRIKYEILDVNEINRKIRIQLIRNKIKNGFIKLRTYHSKTRVTQSDEFYERDYQRDIIEYGYKQIIEHGASYINIPTGTGKTFCGYKIVKKINIDIIVIFSPRLIVNQQNISDKYASMLDHTFIDFSKNKIIKHLNKMVISCCIQSEEKLYEILKDKNIDIADLAAAANLDRRQIYRLLNKENIPKLSTLIRISLAAGIEPQELFALKFDFENYMSENNILKVSKKKK